MVLHQEPDGGAIPAFYRYEAREAGELVMGPHQPVEQEARDYWAEASEAGAAGTQWGVSVSHLLPPSGRPVGGKNAADVGILQPDGSRPRVAGGVAKG